MSSCVQEPKLGCGAPVSLPGLGPGVHDSLGLYSDLQVGVLDKAAGGVVMGRRDSVMLPALESGFAACRGHWPLLSVVPAVVAT